MNIKWRPWMTREDHQLLMSLEPEAALSMHNLMLSQARSDQRFYGHTTPEDPMIVEARAGERRARRACGTGGGRQRKPPATETP